MSLCIKMSKRILGLWISFRKQKMSKYECLESERFEYPPKAVKCLKLSPNLGHVLEISKAIKSKAFSLF